MQRWSRWGWIWLGGVLTLVGHYAWELGQAQFFGNHAGDPLGSYALHCFTASLGDLTIASVLYAVVALVFRRWSWPVEARTLGPATLWLVAGLITTGAFEVGATASGRWTYARSMPTLLGVGLLPLLQWVIVPTLTLLLIRIFWRDADAARPPPAERA